jgi:hypothetical protein
MKLESSLSGSEWLRVETRLNAKGQGSEHQPLIGRLRAERGKQMGIKTAKKENDGSDKEVLARGSSSDTQSCVSWEQTCLSLTLIQHTRRAETDRRDQTVED